MKLIFLFLAIAVSAQHDFSIESNDLIWQKIYSTNKSKEDILKSLKMSGKFEGIQDLGDTVLANITEAPIDLNGERQMAQPIYILSSNITGNVVINFKDDRYRVTVKNIKLIGNMPNLALATNIEELDFYAIKRGEFKSRFLKNDVNVFQGHLENIFVFDNNDDW